MSQAQKIEQPSQQQILAAALINKGVDHYEAQQFEEAVKYLHAALKVDPHAPVAHYNLGMLCRDLGRKDEMLVHLNRAAELAQNDISVINNIANSLSGEHFFLPAIKLLQQAIERFPDSEQAWTSLGDSYYHIGNDTAAEKIYQTLVQKFPASATAQLLDAFYVPQIPMSNEAIDHYRARMMRKMDAMEKAGTRITQLEKRMPHTLFYLMYQGRPHKELAMRIARFFETLQPELLYTAPHCLQPRKQPGAKLKIGFVTPTLHRATLNQFMLGVMERLSNDPDIEFVVFSDAPYQHPQTVKATQNLSHYVYLPKVLSEAQQIVAREEMDVLLYLEVGTEAFMNCLPHARLAPVQCVWGGCAVTTGIPNVDYYISAEDGEPDNAQDHYSEKLVMLPRTLAVFSKPTVAGPAKTREELKLPTGDVRLYACPVMLFKLHPDMDIAFASILERDPKALILLFDPMQKTHQVNLRKRFIATIPAKHISRILFMPFMKKEDFMHMLQAVDCVLDTFHYSFGTTAWLAFGTGVPFVTWEGPYMSSRAASRIYRQIGVMDLVAPTQQEFVERALKLAQDKQFYKAMAEKITARVDTIFDDYSTVDAFKKCALNLYFHPPA